MLPPKLLIFFLHPWSGAWDHQWGQPRKIQWHPRKISIFDTSSICSALDYLAFIALFIHCPCHFMINLYLFIHAMYNKWKHIFPLSTQKLCTVEDHSSAPDSGLGVFQGLLPLNNSQLSVDIGDYQLNPQCRLLQKYLHLFPGTSFPPPPSKETTLVNQSLNLRMKLSLHYWSHQLSCGRKRHRTKYVTLIWNDLFLCTNNDNCIYQEGHHKWGLETHNPAGNPMGRSIVCIVAILEKCSDSKLGDSKLHMISGCLTTPWWCCSQKHSPLNSPNWPPGKEGNIHVGEKMGHARSGMHTHLHTWRSFTLILLPVVWMDVGMHCLRFNLVQHQHNVIISLTMLLSLIKLWALLVNWWKLCTCIYLCFRA